MITYILLALLTTALCQYAVNTGLKPDVTFGNENERFDIASIIREENRFYGVDQDLRRADKNKEQLLFDALKDTITSLRKSNTDFKNTKYSIRRSDTDFAYHDTMDKGGGTVEDFEKSLNKFKKDAEEYSKNLDTAVDGQDGRRKSTGPESEVLMNYAVPVQLNVKGYYQLPLVQ